MNISDEAREAAKAEIRNVERPYGQRERGYHVQSLLDRVRKEDAEKLSDALKRMENERQRNISFVNRIQEERTERQKAETERDTLRAQCDQAIRERNEARAELARADREIKELESL